MIVSLRGRLVAKDQQSAVVECAGVGYGLAMSGLALSQLPDLLSDVFVLVYTQISQDSLRLFGFLDPFEKRLFELFLQAPGVGPKLALGILSVCAPADLVEIFRVEDKQRLRQLPGVGPKKVERLLVELRDHILDLSRQMLVDSRAVRHTNRSTTQQEIESALCNLGFAIDRATVVAAEVARQHPDSKDLVSLVRQALQMLTSANISNGDF